jgi:hypothetical protein
MAKKKEHKNLEYIRASRKGSRLAELEFCTGFVSKHKVHKSSKQYKRVKKVEGE